MRSGIDAEGYRQSPRDKQRGDAQEDCQAGSLRQDVGDRRIAVLDGKAEIAAGEAINPLEVLNNQRLVEAVSAAQVLDGFGR